MAWEPWSLAANGPDPSPQHNNVTGCLQDERLAADPGISFFLSFLNFGMIERRNADQAENQSVPGLSSMNCSLEGLETRILSVATTDPNGGGNTINSACVFAMLCRLAQKASI
ncbi:hypothetical protein DPV78_000184 [Talaromyces pinophilus]|jgi:hypothetical protein|nr:hypothetical protein DPV78_000184 [Talaromyces pinophilus]